MSEIPVITLQVSASDTVQAPIDDTLSVAGQAADAKAVGDAIDALEDSLSEDIDAVSDAVDAVPGTLFPVGSVIITTSDTAPTIGGTWSEVMIPATWGDLEDGARSYTAKGESDTPGTLHFWMRTA